MYLHVHSSGSLLQSLEVLHGKLTFLASTSNLKPAFIIFVNNYIQGGLMHLKVLGENWIEVFYILKYDFFIKKLNITWTLFSCLDSKLLINHINFFFRKPIDTKKRKTKLLLLIRTLFWIIWKILSWPIK